MDDYCRPMKLTFAEAKSEMKAHNWWTERSAYKNWKWVVWRWSDYHTLNECISNGFATQAEAVAHAIWSGFDDGVKRD